MLYEDIESDYDQKNTGTKQKKQLEFRHVSDFYVQHFFYLSKIKYNYMTTREQGSQ